MYTTLKLHRNMQYENKFNKKTNLHKTMKVSQIYQNNTDDIQ